MKGAVLALFCAVALASAEINKNGCQNDALTPHPNCNKFYHCLQGQLIERECAANLVFNVATQECDWPDNVDCSNRPAPESSEEADNDNNGDGDDSNNNGNENPNDAAEICAAEGSDGILVAHENCNQFYKCSEGLPVALDCQLNLLYNPSNEQCDWPENVYCDGRNQGNGNEDSENGNEDSENNGNNPSEEDADSGSNGGINGDPSEAAKICAADGSDGILVAHENCNQFYKCSEGVPVALDCQLNLLYNIENEQCDWPENVNCERRIDGNDNVEDGGDKDEDNNENGGNENPSEASDICTAENSDGILIAHENCNQFYKCSEGKPVALECPLNLLYNPGNEQCDWPENVDCGARKKLLSINKHLRFRN